MKVLGDMGHVEYLPIDLETLLVSLQDRCMVCAKCFIGSKIILDTQKVLLGDEAQVEARFGLFGDSAILDARLVHGLRQKYHRLGNHFGCTR
jgi:hypothetical protein